jgi:hypothetical protein
MTLRRAATTSTVRRFTVQSFCGARVSRAPFAPPRLSVSRYVAADENAVKARSETESSASRTARLRRATSASPTSGCSTAGSGSCQGSSSVLTSGPRYRDLGPMSRWVSLNQALENASVKASKSARNFRQTSR